MDERPLYCMSCGRRRQRTEYLCPALRLDTRERCGGTDYSLRVPGGVCGYVVQGDLSGLLGQVATLAPGGVMLLYGPAGVGKTTLALSAFTRPHFASREMDAGLVASYAERVGAELAGVSWIEVAEEGEEGETIALGIRTPIGDWPDLILDSVNATGAPVAALHAAKRYTARTGARAIVIAHITKAGDVRGSSELQHDCDVIVELAGGRLESIKSRYGATARLEVSRGAGGRLRVPERRRYYSVEGSPGSLRLAPYPHRGARFADVWRWAKRAELSLPPPPAAAAASRSELYASGWIEPDDVEERIAAAHRAGVPYYSPVRGLQEVPGELTDQS